LGSTGPSVGTSQAPRDVLIVGAGQAGAQAALSLRQGGFSGSITLVGDELRPPYERPPLSKDYLAGEKEVERVFLHPPDFWAQRQIELVLGERVVRVAAESHGVETASGRWFGYRSLIWAAGGAPRRLPVPGADLPGVHMIRTLAHVDALKADLANAKRVVIVGGGYIGLEAAAVLVKQGKQVTVVEALDRVLARVTCETLSRFYEAEHRAQGVDIHLNVRIADFAASDSRVGAVRFTAGGPDLPCDVLIVSVGIVPTVEPLAAAGAVTSNGVEIDEYCHTSLPDVYAVGDCANHVNRFAGGERIRLESVQNSTDQAKVAAAAILGKPHPYTAVPWFWSNQYDLKLQTVGLNHGHDAIVLRGHPPSRSFSVVYLKNGRVVALDCVNAVREYVQGRALVERGAVVDLSRLADPTLPLKSFS
jgi:3-phenylpropionate/trans-cinnamate dioxygenase ferredoxin reductase subunit